MLMTFVVSVQVSPPYPVGLSDSRFMLLYVFYYRYQAPNGSPAASFTAVS